MEDKEYQRKNLEAIYRSASMAPIFRRNPKYCIGRFADLTPYISYNDIMDYKYIIRGCHGIDEILALKEGEIIVEYDSLESLINDGWRLD